MVTLSSRTKIDRTAFTVALPSAIALYFANLLTSVCAGGYNNPVVALVIDIQNKKYTLFSGNIAIPAAYEWAMIFGSIAGGMIAGIVCIFLEKVSAKIKEDEMSQIYDSNPSAEVEQQLATSLYLQGKYEPLTQEESRAMDF